MLHVKQFRSEPTVFRMRILYMHAQRTPYEGTVFKTQNSKPPPGEETNLLSISSALYSSAGSGERVVFLSNRLGLLVSRRWSPLSKRMLSDTGLAKNV